MFVYILASRTKRLYVGVTNNLYRRVWQHKTGATPGFASRYGINRLVYFEAIDDPVAAIGRERQIKGWARVKKLAMVEAYNAGWRDLGEHWFDSAKRSDPSLRSG